MNPSLAARLVPIALAAALALGLIATTDRLAAHQYRVAAAARSEVATLAPQYVTVVGRRA